MGSKTYANGRGIAHKKSGGMSIAFPDVCKTPSPGGPIPIPYPNIGQSSDTDKGPKKVKTDGKMPMVKGAKYSMTAGDEAGTAGGGVVNRLSSAISQSTDEPALLSSRLTRIALKNVGRFQSVCGCRESQTES